MKTTMTILGIGLLLLSFFSCSNLALPDVAADDPDSGDDGKPVTTIDPKPDKGDPSVNENYIMDFTSIPGGSPEDYGFTGSIENITIDSEGNIVTQTPGMFSTVTLPQIGAFDRNENGGIVMEWEIKLPYWDGQPWREKNKLYMTLEDDDDNGVYEVLYKPNSIFEFWNPNLILTAFDAENNSVMLDEERTWTIPPTGSGAVWIKFKLVMNPDIASGGNGEVKLYYDETGNGYGNPRISVVDESASAFSQLSITHRNAVNPGYQVMIRNISITTVD